jgi:hypothetical protein
VACASQIKRLTWMLYLVSKDKLLQSKSSLSDMAFLLFAAFYWTLKFVPTDIQCQLLDSISQENEPDSDTRIRQWLMKALKA